MLYVIAYDIADDDRRSKVSDKLCLWGARVQFSVFECEFPRPGDLSTLVSDLTGIMDEDDDQIRIYSLRGDEAAAIRVLGRHRLEEREDYWIV